MVVVVRGHDNNIANQNAMEKGPSSSLSNVLTDDRLLY